MMTRTPDEIKKGLECHINGMCDSRCPYFDIKGGCGPHMNPDALALIQQLQAENAEQAERIRVLEDHLRDATKKMKQLERDKAWAGEMSDMLREENKRLEAQNSELLKKVEQLQGKNEAYEQSAIKCCYESICSARIKKLEDLCKRLKAENEHLEAERDALIKYITDSSWAACDICKHGIDGASAMNCKHIREVGVPCFEWRGVQKEE